MKCPSAQELGAWVNARVEDPARGATLSSHVAGCSDCKVKEARLREVALAFADVRNLEAPDVGALRGEALARWARTEKKPIARPWLVAGFGFSLAAAAVVLVMSLRGAPTEKATVAVQFAPAVHEKIAAVAPRDTVQAVVTLLSGKVEVERDGKTFVAQMSTRLDEKDQLRTARGAKIAAQWKQDSGFLTLGDANVTLSRLEKHVQRFALASGKMWFRVAHEEGESLEVTTPGHRVAVRGTWFSVAAAGKVTTVEVLEGVVEVSELDGSASTLLRAPARAVFGEGKAENRTLTVNEAAALRQEGEMNLLRAQSSDELTKATAAITIGADPEGTLAVDGVVMGSTPLAVRRPIGKHFVEINRPGYQPVRRWTDLGPEGAPLREVMFPQASSKMAAGEIDALLKRRASQIRGCYERRLKLDHSLAGTVKLKLRIGKEGEVASAKVTSSTLPDESVADCLVHETANWKFDTSRNATIVYPFVFRAEE